MSTTWNDERRAVAATDAGWDDPASTPRHRSVSWGAIMAGAVAAVGVGLMLNLLGLATTSTLVDATERATPGVATLAIATGIWLALTTSLGTFLGGVVAARLADTWNRADATLHGLAVWAVATLLAAALLGSALSGGLVVAARGVGSAAGGAAAAVGQVAAAGTSQVNVEALVQQARARLAAPENAAAMPREEALAEAGQLTAQRLAGTPWTREERARMEQLVAALGGISQAQAAERVATTEREIEARLAQAEETARRAADAAAAASAVAAFWAFAALMLSLGAALLGARLGLREARRAAVVRG